MKVECSHLPELSEDFGWWAANTVGKKATLVLSFLKSWPTMKLEVINTVQSFRCDLSFTHRCSTCCYSATREAPPGSCRTGRREPKPVWRCNTHSHEEWSADWHSQDLQMHTSTPRCYLGTYTFSVLKRYTADLTKFNDFCRNYVWIVCHKNLWSDTSNIKLNYRNINV